MKTCFSTLVCPEWEWQDIISAACDLGFDAVEIRGVKNQMDAAGIEQFLPENAQETRALLNAKNLKIACLTSSCELQLKDGRENCVSQTLRYIETARRMGVPYVRVLADGTIAPGAQADIEYIAGLLLELGARAQERGVTLLIESNGCFADSKKLLNLLQCVGSPAIAALWDIHHPYRYFGEKPSQTAKILGSYIKHVHIKDSVLENGGVRYRLTGQGDVPIGEAVGALASMGYKGCCSFEWLRRWDPSLEDAGIALPQFLQYMRGLEI